MSEPSSASRTPVRLPAPAATASFSCSSLSPDFPQGLVVVTLILQLRHEGRDCTPPPLEPSQGIWADPLASATNRPWCAVNRCLLLQIEMTQSPDNLVLMVAAETSACLSNLKSDPSYADKTRGPPPPRPGWHNAGGGGFVGACSPCISSSSSIAHLPTNWGRCLTLGF